MAEHKIHLSEKYAKNKKLTQMFQAWLNFEHLSFYEFILSNVEKTTSLFYVEHLSKLLFEIVPRKKLFAERK